MAQEEGATEGRKKERKKGRKEGRKKDLGRRGATVLVEVVVFLVVLVDLDVHLVLQAAR